jgi:hypothetical protein
VGCGGSREAEEQPIAMRPQARPGTGRARTARSSQGPPGTAGGRRAAAGGGRSSRHGPPSSRQGASRAGSSSGKGGSGAASSSRQGGSRSGSRPSTGDRRDRHEGRKPRSRLPDVEEQPPEDSAIEHEISTLDVYIDQHSENHYRTHSDNSGMSIRRRIGETILERVIEGNPNGIVISSAQSPFLNTQA